MLRRPTLAGACCVSGFVLISLLFPVVAAGSRVPSSRAAAWLNVSQLISAAGYPVENHVVQTSDGFLLSLQRIPHGREGTPGAMNRRKVDGQPQQQQGNKPVVLLQHGLLDSAATWVVNSPKESLGYILADAGFDVWLSNSRGNVYSARNIYYSPDSVAFWDLVDLDLMASIDLPTVVDGVLSLTTAPSLVYVGHSQGTTIGFAAFPENKALADKIDVFVALAPAAFARNIESLFLDFLADSDLSWVLANLGEKEFLPDDWITKLAAKTVCKIEPIICEDVIFAIAGPSHETNETKMPAYISHTPAGTSVRNMMHWAQFVKVDDFRMFDYGSAAANREHYNSSVPPSYRPQDLTSPPTAIFAGGLDILADPIDVAHLKSVLPKGQPVFENTQATYAHLDFVWAENAWQTIYPDVVSLARKYMGTARAAVVARKHV